MDILTKNLDIVTVGSSLQDYLIDIPETLLQEGNIIIPLGDKVSLTASPRMFIGGGGANTAVNFANLGFSVGIISRIANDTAGNNVKRRLKQCGVDLRFLQISEKSPLSSTGSSFILNIPQYDRSVLVNRGVSKNIEFDKICYDDLLGIPWVYISSLSSLDTDELKDFCEFCSKQHIKIAFNPGEAQQKCGIRGLNSILDKTHILFLNKMEAYKILGKDYDKSLNELEDIVVQLHDAGPEIIVITDGAFGSYAFSQGILYFMPTYKTNTVSTIGAGDAFASTFTAGIMKGKDVPECLMDSAANAALVVTQVGANIGLGNYQDIKKMILAQPDVKPAPSIPHPCVS